MKKLDPYINDLLYDHDCVIVTDLGGFIGKYHPFSLNPSLSIAAPSNKQIAFNGSLKHNDGLLASYISQKEALNYAEACEVIKDYVDGATKSLEKGQKIHIQNIGTLFRNKDSKLEFTPESTSNFLPSSFGLTPVHAPVIKNAASTIAVSKKSNETEAFTGDSEKHTTNVSKWKKWRLSEVVPAAAVLAMLMITPPVLDRFNAELGTLIPFSRMNEFYHEKIKKDVVEQPPYQLDIPSPFNVSKRSVTADENTDGISELSVDVSIESSDTPENTSLDNNHPSTSTAIATPILDNMFENEGYKQYHVIGGCFRELENAENFVIRMSSMGANAKIIGQNNNGLYMVSLFHSGSVTAIHDTLTNIRQAFITGAWVAHR